MLIVVLGHSDSGAIKGAIDDVQLGHLTSALAKIRPVVKEVTDIEGARNSKNKKFVQNVARRNAKDSAAGLTMHSPVLAALVKDGKLNSLISHA
ncbi:MAG TPA: carbonic anhydrase [Steroidobacteraceae bacterium]